MEIQIDGGIEITLKDSGCGVDIPEMTVIPEPGVNIAVSNVNLFDEFGNAVTGKSYELTNSGGKKLVIQIHEAVKVTPGVRGHFVLDYQGTGYYFGHTGGRTTGVIVCTDSVLLSM